jgi:hypothetical protein
MAYTTRQLITRAFYLSAKVSQDFETVSGDDEEEGLQLLNALLNIKTANQRLIPYYQEYDFNAIVGQEKYFIPNLVMVETLTFTIGSVRYAMTNKTRFEYFATPRANNVESLPYQYHVERAFDTATANDGSNLYMYYLPQQPYPFTMYAKFALADVTLDQDLSLTVAPFYLEYLRYALSEYICNEYNISLPPQALTKLNEIESIIFDISPIDFTQRKISTLHKQTSHADIYVQANIAQGWWPN